MESSIQVGVSGPAVWVRVEGKGSFLNSGNFKQFVREMVDRGYREFVVDLVDCVMMDSTFMGTMAGLALRLKEIGQGHLRVVHCGERSRQLRAGWVAESTGFRNPLGRTGQRPVFRSRTFAPH